MIITNNMLMPVFEHALEDHLGDVLRGGVVTGEFAEKAKERAMMADALKNAGGKSQGMVLSTGGQKILSWLLSRDQVNIICVRKKKSREDHGK